ncbi:MAG: endonuclease [Candidatus Contendobacter sp.]|nr:endonuclease [Candidatus Contendobacter sp.]
MRLRLRRGSADRPGELRTLSGRACCQAVDPLFEAAHNDLFNLVPAVGEVNGKRSDFNWGMIPGEKRKFGTCNTNYQ